MVLHKSLRLTSFWQLQALGWVCFYVWTLLGSLPDILRRSGALRENTVVVVLLFLGTCIIASCLPVAAAALPFLDRV